jgi:hypothetical protein
MVKNASAKFLSRCFCLTRPVAKRATVLRQMEAVRQDCRNKWLRRYALIDAASTSRPSRSEEQGAVDATPNDTNSVGVRGVRLGKRGALVPFRPERVHRNRGGDAILS